MATEKTTKDSVIFWQKYSKEDDGVAEPAILVSPYSDILTLHQGTSYININYESLDELVKVLKNMKKAHGAS